MRGIKFSAVAPRCAQSTSEVEAAEELEAISEMSDLGCPRFATRSGSRREVDADRALPRAARVIIKYGIGYGI